MEEAVVFDLPAALFGRINIPDNGAQQKNFRAYDLLKLA